MLNHWHDVEDAMGSPVVIWSVIIAISLAAVVISLWLKQVFHR